MCSHYTVIYCKLLYLYLKYFSKISWSLETPFLLSKVISKVFQLWFRSWLGNQTLRMGSISALLQQQHRCSKSNGCHWLNKRKIAFVKEQKLKQRNNLNIKKLHHALQHCQAPPGSWRWLTLGSNNVSENMLLSQLSLPLSVESNMKSHDDSEPCVRFQNTLLQVPYRVSTSKAPS